MQADVNTHQPTAIWLASAFRATLPVILGYMPVGFAYGVLAQKNGLGAANTLAMSVVVFAGSAQLIGVGLIGAGAGLWSIVATTFVVNLRHLLMAAALSPHLRGLNRAAQAWFGYQLTDETFAIHSVRFGRGENDPRETFAINAIAQASWVVGTCLGLMLSGLVTDVRPIGLDYALPAMFVALLVAQIRGGLHVLVALLAGGASVALALGGVAQWNVIAATVLGASAGVLVEQWTRN